MTSFLILSLFEEVCIVYITSHQYIIVYTAYSAPYTSIHHMSNTKTSDRLYNREDKLGSSSEEIMKVLCAGFPKTGTKSMALALRELGYSVHDFEEHLQFNLDNYLDFFEGRVGEEVFLEMYKDVDVVVDQPACTLWNIIRGQFPGVQVCNLGS